MWPLSNQKAGSSHFQLESLETHSRCRQVLHLTQKEEQVGWRNWLHSRGLKVLVKLEGQLLNGDWHWFDYGLSCKRWHSNATKTAQNLQNAKLLGCLAGEPKNWIWSLDFDTSCHHRSGGCDISNFSSKRHADRPHICHFFLHKCTFGLKFSPREISRQNSVNNRFSNKTA